MALDERGIIERFFTGIGAARRDVALGVGDDAAVLDPGAGSQLVAATDTLVAGVHFPLDTDPRDIGIKSLAVNLSDLAAMGAEPRWALLALTMPGPEADWLERFSGGFRELAEAWSVALVGGDLTRGPLTVTVQVLGSVPAGQAICRHTARPGDGLYVTGELGGAGLALRLIAAGRPRENIAAALVERLDRPVPRVTEGIALRGIASAAMDLSDGLALDLARLCRASGVGADVDLGRLPLSPECAALDGEEGLDLALGAGDDYELCFTVPPGRQEALASTPIRATCIGTITEAPGVRWRGPDGRPFEPPLRGYQHF